jgi:ABC-type glycerol-3-phosphate transport system substrate-binding protein
MRKFKLVAPFMTAVLVLAACGNGDGDGGDNGDTGDLPEGDGSILVTSLWGGAEEAAFQEVLAAFEESSGIEVAYEANRTDYQSVIRTRLQGGNPFDVAIVPGIAFFRQLAAEGSFIPLSDLGIELADIEGQFAPGLLDYGNVDDVQYAFMAKLNGKASIFYSPERFEDLGVAPVETWDDLVQLTEDIKAAGATPWAVGAGDGWTVTDWFMYIREHGVEAYDTLFSPDGDWTDPTVAATIDRMTSLLTDDNVVGGIDGALSLLFVDAISEVFSTSPSAEMYFGGSFVGGIATGVDVNPDLAGQEGEAIDWFPFPTIEGSGDGLVTFGGDQIAAMVADTDTAAFLEYMLSTEAAEIWAAQGTVYVPNTNVDPSTYPTLIMQKDAELINSAEAIRFDGSDLLPGTDLGPILQSALRGEDMGPILEEFQTATSTAWESQ